MKIPNLAIYALSLAFAATLGACSSAVPASSPLESAALTQAALLRGQHPELATLPGLRSRLMHAHAHTQGGRPVQPGVVFPTNGVVWIADSGSNMVWRCTNPGTLTCVPKAGLGWNEPQGMAADAINRVYVADTANSRVVRLSPSGGTPHAFADPGYYPVGVAVATNGVVCATNIFSTAGTQGSIECYQGTNSWSICCGMYEYYFDAFDSAGNLYADGYDSSGNVQVEEIANAAGGSTAEVNSGITSISFPGGMQVRLIAPHYLLIDDQNGHDIQQFILPGYGAGTPASFPLSGTSDIVDFGLKPGDLNLWGGDAGNQTGNAYGDPTGAVHYALSNGFIMPEGEVYTPYGQY
ncbi:MAG TPA: hypothetical protein VGX91_04750 [Candidatus Cybelea sp.]|nr:hypothetical protein [Candidatus Cybelea sp.]